MPTLRVTDDQVVELIKQLPPDRKRAALIALAREAEDRREARMAQAEASLREISRQRGQDWDVMDEDEKERLVNDLIHEDRPCSG